MSNRRSLLTCAAAAVALAAAPAGDARAASSAREEVRLSAPRVSALGGGAYVVTFESAGDIRGLLTLTLKANGASVTGEWVLVSRYIYDSGSGSEELTTGLAGGEHASTVHEESVAFRERGTLKGAVSGGAVVFDAEGRLAAIDGLQLAVADGNLEFSGSTGAGSAFASNLQDPRNGSGTLVVTREVRR